MNTNLIDQTIRPNRLETKDKGKEYHAQYGRWGVASAINHPLHRAFVINTIIYWRFYSNDQWILDDDLEGFLSDETGFARNRLKLRENIIMPMVNQFEGNAIRLDFNAKAVNVSPYVINRRENQLREKLMMNDVAEAAPSMKEHIKNKYGIGDTKAETEQLFNHSFVDEHTRDINELLVWSKGRNNFEDNLTRIATHMAISGIGIHKGYEQAGEQQWEVTDSLFYFFDRGAKRPDLKDAGYMGELLFGNPAEVFEKYQDLTHDERKRIENYCINNYDHIGYLWHLFMANKDRVPMYEIYWKDIERQEYGYVMDDYGYEFFTQINAEGIKYTDKDLIIPKGENYKKVLGKKNKTKKTVKFVDVLRFCVFTPSEIIGGATGEDIVYDYGIARYQETYNLDPSLVEYPYKARCVHYHNGEILSPIQNVIDPQRMLNRTLSVLDSHMNNAMGFGPIIDTSVVSAQGAQNEVIRNMNLSKPVFVDAKRGGVQNMTGNYGSNASQQMGAFMQMAQLMRTVAQNTSGVNESMQGTAGGSNKLVGVEQLKIDRGSLQQEGFYYCLNNIMLQTFQSVATQGKRIYADSPRRLSMIVGDVGAKEIRITKEMNNEDFRVFVKKSIPDNEEKMQVNALILQLKQFDLIGEKQAADLFNRGDMELVAEKMREYFNEKQIAAVLESKKAEAQNQEVMAAASQDSEQAKIEMEEQKRYQEYLINKEAENKDQNQMVKDAGKLQQIAKKQEGEMLNNQFKV